MPKISVIVPIYNMEQYLDRSIKSLLSQSFLDIEIILVNDGSKDKSLDICKKYKIIDKRIIIIDKVNGGVSSARNEGLKIATGDYIGFIDPDDWIESNMYYALYQKITSGNYDVAMCNYVQHDNIKVKEVRIPTSKQVLNREDIIGWLIPNLLGPKDLNSNASRIMGSVCRLLIKKELIFKKGILFPKQLTLMEDLVWCIEIFANTNQIIIDNGAYYHYMNNEGSAVNIYRKDMKELQQTVFNKIKNILITERLYERYEDRLNIRYVRMFIFSIVNETHTKNDRSVKEKLQEIKYLCKDNQLKKILKSINMKGYTFRKRMILNAIEKEWSVYVYLYYTIFNRFFR